MSPKKIQRDNNAVHLISGAKGVLGQAVAERFLRAGFPVVGLDVRVENASSVGQDPENSNLKWVQMDVSDSRSVQNGMDLILRQGYEIDSFIHCAGGFRFNYIEKTSDEELDFLLNVNLKSAFLLSREVIPLMRKREYGRILYLGSESTLNPRAGMAAYAASKAGLNSLVKALADEVKGLDVTVNAILPSIIDTAETRKRMPKANFDDWVKPEALADIIFNLTQEFGNPINGAIIPVTGRV